AGPPLATAQEAVEERLASGPFLRRQGPGVSFPLGDTAQALPDPETTLGGVRQPGTERDPVFSSSRLSGSRHVGVDGHGPFHHAHAAMVAPLVLPNELPEP